MSRFIDIHSNLIFLDLENDWSGADFSKAQSEVKKFEGKYQAMPNDAGNYSSGKVGVGKLIGTNWGISAPTLKAYLKREPTVEDMKNLSYDTALKIYKSQYWDAIGGDRINDDSIALLVYDGAVNQGVGSIKRIVSDSLGEAYSTTAINKANQPKLFQKIKQGREDYYKSLNSSFYSAWIKRLDSIAYEGKEFAKRHWLGLTLSLAAIGTLTYYGFKYRSQIAKTVFS